MVKRSRLSRKRLPFLGLATNQRQHVLNILADYFPSDEAEDMVVDKFETPKTYDGWIKWAKRQMQ